MKTSYSMDIGNNSFSLSHTPSIQSQRLPFYLHGLGHFHAHSSYFTEREGLDSYLLIYTISGRGYLEYRTDSYILDPNHAVIFYCKEPQLYKTLSETPWEFKWAHINGSAMEEYYNIINGDSLSMVYMGESSHMSKEFEELFRTASENTIFSNLKINSVLTGIMTGIALSRHSSLNNRKYFQHKAEIDKVTSFIQENYNNKITMEDLTNLVFISKYHFLRLFKKSTGLSPYEYLINFRINLSKSLLTSTELSISEICHRVGFTDINNFIRYFKRLVGVTPSHYRKNWPL